MARDVEDTELHRLRRRAEAAIRSSRRHRDALPVLERISQIAAEGSENALFADRHLAELLLEQHPWRAALHLRRLARHLRDDDVVHALMGLCQALLGNFHAAASAYRRALSLSIDNPWYHHNLGHLLDVALAQPQRALPHLRSAHELEPLEHEIAASLAHCLAGLGDLEEARALATDALRADPKNRDHRSLVRWIDAGAKSEDNPRKAKDTGRPPRPAAEGPAGGSGGKAGSGRGRGARRRGTAEDLGDDSVLVGVNDFDEALLADVQGADVHDADIHGASGQTREADEDDDLGGARAGSRAPVERSEGRGRAVIVALEEGMREAGFSARQLDRARALWCDYRDGRRVRVVKPEVYAAAVEYAIALVHGLDGVTQASVARRYGVAPTSLSHRYGEIREALALEPGDPRYAAFT